MKSESNDLEYDRISLLSHNSDTDNDKDQSFSSGPWSHSIDYYSSGVSSQQNNKDMMNRVLYHLTIMGISMAGLAVIFLMSDKVMKPSKIAASIFKTEDKTIYTLYRDGYEPLEYFTDSSVASYEFLKDYDAVIEPRVDNYLYVSSFNEKTDTSYKYTICEKDNLKKCSHGTLSNDDKSSEFKTSPVHASCQPYDEYIFTISAYDKSGNLDKIYTKSAICIYVRRELRALTSNDLDATMDAMHTLWDVDEKDGQKKYGNNYHSSTYFVEAHHFNAAWQDGDHIHEGLGFLPQHIKITNMFELAMQAVEPSVSLPYWDYTIESANGDTIFDSYAFTKDTFGSLEGPKDEYWGWTYRDDKIKDGRIKNGRWKHAKADKNTKYEDLDSNFGYLRAPWNTNPSPYISRFSAYTTQLPTCFDYYIWLQYDSLADFLSNSPYSPHSSTHGAIGAVFGCDKMDELREAGLIIDSDEQVSLCQKWSFIIKELYRYNFISASKDCKAKSLDEDGFSCPYVCNADRLDTLSIRLSSVIGSRYVGTLSLEQWGKWRDFICYGDGHKIFVGDHVESASPADPSFWPIHPSLERLFQAKYISGGFTDDSWSDDPTVSYVCDKSQCYEDGEYDWHEECCYGHYEKDQLLDFVNGDKDKGYGATNKEVVEDTNASNKNYGMPYIYDSFKWDHCTEQDFDSKIIPSKASNSMGNQLIWGNRK